MNAVSGMVFVALLAAPGYALSRLNAGLDGRILAGIAVVVSFVTFLAYRHDKRRAERKESRIPEMTLHLGELMGGWPGAFLAQRIFRHKTSKVSFQIVYGMIVALYQFAAVDSLREWSWSRQLWHWMQAQVV